jgi:hypothetical protein
LGVPAEDIVPVGKSVQDFVKENGLQGRIDTVLEFVDQGCQHTGSSPQDALFEKDIALAKE